jgi:hypothetical protein
MGNIDPFYPRTGNINRDINSVLIELYLLCLKVKLSSFILKPNNNPKKILMKNDSNEKGYIGF